jgi:hypothetical protein
MTLIPTAITILLEDALIKITAMVVSGHEFESVNPRALDSCPGISYTQLGVFLLTLRFALFSLMLLIIGVALSTYWLFGVVRSGERDRQFHEDDLIFSKPRTEAKTNCTCSICKHIESKTCIEIRCVYCVLMRDKQIIGHFNRLHQ